MIQEFYTGGFNHRKEGENFFYEKSPFGLFMI